MIVMQLRIKGGVWALGHPRPFIRSPPPNFLFPHMPLRVDRCLRLVPANCKRRVLLEAPDSQAFRLIPSSFKRSLSEHRNMSTAPSVFLTPPPTMFPLQSPRRGCPCHPSRMLLTSTSRGDPNLAQTPLGTAVNPLGPTLLAEFFSRMCHQSYPSVLEESAFLFNFREKSWRQASARHFTASLMTNKNKCDVF